MSARVFFALLLAAVLATPSMAQPLPPEFAPDRVFDQIAANRPAYERVVFIFGDSVSMMCSLEEVDFSKIKEKANDPQYMISAMATLMRSMNDPGEKAKDPLWPMHSLASAMNAQFAASGLLTTPDAGLTIPSAALVATYAGALGMPLFKDVEARARFLTERIEAGLIRDGDVVVFEDAGYNGQDPDVYEDDWLALGRAVLPRVGVTLVMMDMFDDIPEEPVMGLPPDAFRYDAPFPSPKTGGSRSHNQALRDAVAKLAAQPDNKGQLVFLDMRARMDAFRAALRETLGVAALMPEGIHPNVWGEALLAREILRAADLAPLVTNPRPYLDLLAANAKRLALTKNDVDQAKAREFIDAWLVP